MDKVDRVIEYFRGIREEVSAPTNALVHGKIAGTKEAGDDPPVRKRNRFIYQSGLRKWWRQNMNNNK